MAGAGAEVTVAVWAAGAGTQSAYSAHVGGFAYTLRHKISKSAYNTVIFTVEPECDPDQEQTVSWWAD